MTNVLEYASDNRRGWVGAKAAWWWARAWYAIGGVLVPIVCWVHSFRNSSPPHPEWQSGHWVDYVGLVLKGQVAWPLFPFMGFSALCLLLLLGWRERMAHQLWVRLGVYLGVLQAGIFLVALLVTTSLISVAISGVTLVVAGAAIGAWWLIRKFAWIALWILTGFVGFSWLFYALWVLLRGGLRGPWWLIVAEPFMALDLFALGGGAFAALLAYGLMASWLLWRKEGRRSKANTIAGVVVGALWAGAYVWAWHETVRLALEAYAKLPTKAPSHCYVATAATRGHRRWVGTERVVVGVGPEGLWVNDQLRVLKGGEVALEALWPAGHKACRRIYDAVGPRLARRLGHPLLADLAYAGLKPAEWATRVVLWALGVGAMVKRLYR